MTDGCQGTRENHVLLSHVAVLHHVPRHSFSGSMSKQTAVQPSSLLVHLNTVLLQCLLKTAHMVITTTYSSVSDVTKTRALSIQVLNVIKRVATTFTFVFFLSVTRLVRQINGIV